MRVTNSLLGTSNSSGPMHNPSMVSRSISRNHSCGMGLALWQACSRTRIVRTLLSLSITGDTNWSQDIVLVPCFFPGLCYGRKTELASMLHGTKEQEFVALNLARVLCRSGLPTPAK